MQKGVIVFIALSAALSACSMVAGLDALQGDAKSKTNSKSASEAGTMDDDQSSQDSSSSDNGGSDGGVREGGGTGNACGDKPGPAMVRIDNGGNSFCIDSTEVTNEQYAAFLAAKGNNTDGQPQRCGWNDSFVPARDWPASGDKANFPVVFVDWCDAFAYCAWAGKRMCGKIGGGSVPNGDADEPNVSQWMNACTGGGKTRYPDGDSRSGNCNVERNQLAAVKSNTKCEGGYPGIFDMSGNVEEWEDQCDTSGGGPGDFCTNRGGSSFDDDRFAACGNPQAYRRAYKEHDVGIRCCSP